MNSESNELNKKPLQQVIGTESKRLQAIEKFKSRVGKASKSRQELLGILNKTK